MKQIYILRHTEWDEVNLQISQSGLNKINKLKPGLPKFSIIKSSPVKRAIETAKLLTNQNPVTDERASIINSSEKQQATILKTRADYEGGTFQAIMNIPELVEALKSRSKELTLLIKEVLSELEDNQLALIVSHDAIILGAKKILQGQPFEVTPEKYGELCGFVINENLEIKEFKPKLN